MDYRATITLDVAYDEPTVDDALKEMTTDLEVVTQIVNEYGPGGGWPEVKFAGSMEDVVEIVRRYAGEDCEHALFLCEAIRWEESS